MGNRCVFGVFTCGGNCGEGGGGQVRGGATVVRGGEGGTGAEAVYRGSPSG